MNRREFLKSAFTLAALSPFARLCAKEGPDGNKSSDVASGVQVTRRQYRNTNQTVPLLGFGLMRLPRITPDKPEIDYEVARKMIDRAMKAGANYFDTAYMYHSGLSEKFVGDVISSNYPRDSFYLADKMPPHTAKSEDDVKEIFFNQLEKCKTNYFDFYLMHALDEGVWKEDNDLKVYEFLTEMKKQGKIRRLGFSFHDTPQVLQKIVDAHKDEWDFVQIQLNYLDWNNYQSKEQYEIVTKAGLPIVVMEPLRGGYLANLTPEAAKILRDANPQGSVASWAFRYVGSFPNVLCVLSGMTLPEHVEDNIATFSPLVPLNDNERATLDKALVAYRKSNAIGCTACQYCMPCPFGVEIPKVFGMYNQHKIKQSKFHFVRDYGQLDKGNASSCVGCGHCKTKCPQKLDIPTLLKEVDKEYLALKK